MDARCHERYEEVDNTTTHHVSSVTNRRFARLSDEKIKSESSVMNSFGSKRDDDDDSFDHYKILEVPEDASRKELRKAYRRAALKCHPDKDGGDSIRFRRVVLAYETLSDASKRSQYDKERRKRHRSKPSFSTTTFFDLFSTTKERKRTRSERGSDEQPKTNEQYRPDKERCAPKEAQERQQKAKERHAKRQRKAKETRRAREDERLRDLYSSRVSSSRSRTVKIMGIRGSSDVPSSEKALRRFFRTYGEIERVQVGRNHSLIVFRTTSAASNAIWCDRFHVTWSVT